MRKIIHLIYILTLFLSCKKENISNYYESEDLEERNLFGNVKSYAISGARINNFDVEQTEEFIIDLREEFTNNGQISSIEYFDYSGEPIEKTKKFYDDNCVKTVDSNGEEVICTTTDSLNRIEYQSHTINDRIKIKIIKVYNHLNLIKTKMAIHEAGADTTFTEYAYKYDSNNNVILKEEMTDNYTNVFEYKYNEQGKMIEEYEEYEFYRYKKSITYKEGKISEINKQNLMAMPYQRQDIIGYDQNKNETYLIGYLNHELKTINKYDYEFDDMGNWIKKITFSSESLENQKFKPVYMETRKIDYWE